MKTLCTSVAFAAPLLFVALNAHAQDAGAPVSTTPQPPAETTAPPPPPPPTATATASSATAAPAPVANEASGQKETGFTFEAHLYSQFVSFGAGLGTTLTLPLVTGGIFGGYKLDRLIVGLGFDFTSSDTPGSGGAKIAMRWTPGLRYAFVRSSDERVELFGQFDFGIGHDFGSAQSNEILTPDLGIGARYWVHRQFAVSAVGGWVGNWQLTQSPDTSSVTQGIFAGVQMLGVF